VDAVAVGVVEGIVDPVIVGVRVIRVGPRE
jgi:hypothetical protein